MEKTTMLMVNQLIGFGVGGDWEVLVDRTLGTNIGNMTAVGGLAAAWVQSRSPIRPTKAGAERSPARTC